MARADEYKVKTESPVVKYLSWSSNDKCFTYWDKASSSNKKVALPFNMIHLADMSTIKGWHDASSSGIYSNEVKSTKNEELNVRAFKGGELIKGLYRDIKDRVNALGGDYHASVYGFINGEIVNISLKGAALKAWSDFATENRSSFLGSYIAFTGALDAKKGSVKYSVPVCEKGGAISAKDNEASELAHSKLTDYFASRTSTPVTAVEEVQAEEVFAPKFADAPAPVEKDELPF